jgi:hypothetical protein
MMARAVQTVAGETDSVAAWDKLFKHFNKTHGRGSGGYRSGEKIVVKVNFVGCIRIWDRGEATT